MMSVNRERVYQMGLLFIGQHILIAFIISTTIKYEEGLYEFILVTLMFGAGVLAFLGVFIVILPTMIGAFFELLNANGLANLFGGISDFLVYRISGEGKFLIISISSNALTGAYLWGKRNRD